MTAKKAKLPAFFHWVCACCGALDAGGWRSLPPHSHTQYHDDNHRLIRFRYGHAWVLGISDTLNVPPCRRR